MYIESKTRRESSSTRHNIIYIIYTTTTIFELHSQFSRFVWCRRGQDMRSPKPASAAWSLQFLIWTFEILIFSEWCNFGHPSVQYLYIYITLHNRHHQFGASGFIIGLLLLARRKYDAVYFYDILKKKLYSCSCVQRNYCQYCNNNIL